LYELPEGVFPCPFLVIAEVGEDGSYLPVPPRKASGGRKRYWLVCIRLSSAE